MKTRYLSIAAVAASMSLAPPLTADEPDIPKCEKPYGSVALQEPTGGNWWQSYDLENPQALIKYYVNESGCFTLVDRGSGLSMGMSERDLAASGELQVDSNMGGGQLLSADFFLVPDLIADDRDSGGNGIAGALSKKVGGKLGGLLGGVNTTKLEADTILTLVNSRTGVQEVTARGEASKRDISISLDGFLEDVNGGYTSYQDTEIGRVIATAYATAYTDLVAKVKGMAGDTSTAPPQSYVIALNTDMYQKPERGETVRGLRQGMRVFPTGTRDGAFLQVKDKFGTEGWVSVEDLE